MDGALVECESGPDEPDDPDPFSVQRIEGIASAV